MTEKDKKEFAAIMYALAENFSATLTKAGLVFRFEALKEYSIEQVRSAALSIVKTRKFLKMPTIAEFIEHIEGGSVDDIALVEATKVLEAVKAHGAYKSVVFDNPVTQAVVEYTFGGWVKLNEELSAKDEKWFLKDFEKSYMSFSKQNVKLGGVLMGITDHQNALYGYKKSQPVCIGDPKKAEAVMLMGEESRNNNALSSADNLLAGDQFKSLVKTAQKKDG